MGLRVMIVDDSSVMRKIVERSLRQASKQPIEEVLEAGDGSEAIERLEGRSVDLVFSDINMPSMNGLELLAKLQEGAHRQVPVILVTTEGDEKTVVQAIELGAKGFIRKPFTPTQMELAVRRALA